MTRRVEFCETDAAGIAHFSAFFQYMEQAEHALLRHLGLSVVLEDEDGFVSWPRVSAHCDYEGAAHFEDVLDIDLGIERIGTRSVSYRFLFCHCRETVAQGTLVSVCCRVEHGKPLRSIAIPDSIAALLKPYLMESDV